MINETGAISHDFLSLTPHNTNKLKEHLNMISGGATFSTGFSSKAFVDFSDRSVPSEEKDKIRLSY